MSTLPISIFHKILIFLEDHSGSSFDTLLQFGSFRQVVGSLGRLEGLKLIERDQKALPILFSLSQSGDKYLSQRVSVFPIKSKNNQQLYIIILTNKALNRIVRYTITTLINNSGAVMLQSGVWLTPLQDRIAFVKQEIERLQLDTSVYIFQIQTQSALQYCQPTKQLITRYKNTFKYLKMHLRHAKKSALQRFEAKCAIFYLSEVVQSDLLLLTGTSNNRWIGNEASKWYIKYRTLITN